MVYSRRLLEAWRMGEPRIFLVGRKRWRVRERRSQRVRMRAELKRLERKVEVDRPDIEVKVERRREGEKVREPGGEERSDE